jgi:hypothetical protein
MGILRLFALPLYMHAKDEYEGRRMFSRLQLCSRAQINMQFQFRTKHA